MTFMWRFRRSFGGVWYEGTIRHFIVKNPANLRENSRIFIPLPKILKQNTMETFLLEELKRIANKSASELTKDDKTFILAQCEEYGVEVKSKRCLSCYIDAAVELYRTLTKERSQDDSGKKAIHYRLKEGVNVTYNGERVNADTITDERAESLLRSGFPIGFFDIEYCDED